VTSGYSTIFPKDIPIGTIKSFSVDKGSSNFNIEVELFNDVRNESIVYVVNNTLAEEQKALEAEVNE